MGISLGGGLGALAAINPVTAIATLAGGGANIMGAYFGKRAQDKALNQAGLQNAMTLMQQQKLFDQERADAERRYQESAPWRAAAKNALFMQRRWLENPELDPMTRLYINEGKGALRKSLAARGLSDSGVGIESEKDLVMKYLAQDKADRLRQMNAMTGYVAPSGPANYGNIMSATANYGSNASRYALDRGKNQADFYGTVADTISGIGRDAAMGAGYGIFGGGGGAPNPNIMNWNPNQNRGAYF